MAEPVESGVGARVWKSVRLLFWDMWVQPWRSFRSMRRPPPPRSED